MIKSVIKYYSDIDPEFIFPSKELAQSFEDMYKGFYLISDDCEDLLDKILNDERYDPRKEQEALFNRAKEELTKWCDKIHPQKTTKNRLLETKNNKIDLNLLASYFLNPEQHNGVIGRVFDTLYDILTHIEEK